VDIAFYVNKREVAKVVIETLIVKYEDLFTEM
jgi:hypothetical protein